MELPCRARGIEMTARSFLNIGLIVGTPQANIATLEGLPISGSRRGKVLIGLAKPIRGLCRRRAPFRLAGIFRVDF